MVFVGHGLSKDFRVINITPPKGQIIDTVDLFYLSGNRKMSLRFLMWHFFGIGMQQSSSGHDSIEDAAAALKLYKLYQKLSADKREWNDTMQVRHLTAPSPPSLSRVPTLSLPTLPTSTRRGALQHDLPRSSSATLMKRPAEIVRRRPQVQIPGSRLLPLVTWLLVRPVRLFVHTPPWAKACISPRKCRPTVTQAAVVDVFELPEPLPNTLPLCHLHHLRTDASDVVLVRLWESRQRQCVREGFRGRGIMDKATWRFSLVSPKGREHHPPCGQKAGLHLELLNFGVGQPKPLFVGGLFLNLQRFKAPAHGSEQAHLLVRVHAWRLRGGSPAGSARRARGCRGWVDGGRGRQPIGRGRLLGC